MPDPAKPSATFVKPEEGPDVYFNTIKINRICQHLSPTCLCSTHDDRFLYVVNNNGIIVQWDLAMQERLAVTKAQKTNNIHQLYSCPKDRTVKDWSLNEMFFMETLHGRQTPATSIDKKPQSIVKFVHGMTDNGEVSAITSLLNTDVIASRSCDGDNTNKST
ncbi:uncharacterized protein LOC135701888 [Ochlerotatus camptorhynchus]|uniref:uncharacterized protein LOC135701888 n=1 Tax=Ochlerotatus camptorhynchus TaxID=644619 RepID=UPI0031DD7108